MEEKVIVNDVLSSSKNCLKEFENIIVETENMELRQTFQNIRNTLESFQFELFKIAESKGYYEESENATQEELSNFKSEITNL
jgi:spore coat protein CotF